MKNMPALCVPKKKKMGAFSFVVAINTSRVSLACALARHTHARTCAKDISTIVRISPHTDRDTDRDTETQRHRDTETQRHRDTETQRHRDTETQRH